MHTALLIDDEPAMVHAIAQMFEAHDWDVVTAANGTKAVALAHERYFDLVLCDVIMDGLVGTPLLEALRDTRGAADALLVLMSNMQERRVRRLVEGDYAFIAKPFAFDDLLALIADKLPDAAAAGRGLRHTEGARVMPRA